MQNPLMQKPETIRVFGSAGSALAYAIRNILYRSLFPFEWIEVRSAGEFYTAHHLDCPRHLDLPVCMFADGIFMENPMLAACPNCTGYLKTILRNLTIVQVDSGLWKCRYLVSQATNSNWSDQICCSGERNA